MTWDNDTGLEEENPLEIYRIELESFQGPLDLLLHLIKKNEIDIYDIPVADITNQYLAYLDMMRELNLDVASEFLVMASNLIYLKSRMLLPPDEEDEEAEEQDPREELIRRLIEYQKYRKAAEEIGGRPVLGSDVFIRPEEGKPQSPDDVYVEATMFQLMDAFQRVLAKAEMRKPHEVSRITFTIEDGISHINDVLRDRTSIRFAELFTGLEGRTKVVTVFLSVLEMIKKNTIRAIQEDHLGPLRLMIVDPAERVVIEEPDAETRGPGDAGKEGHREGEMGREGEGEDSREGERGRKGEGESETSHVPGPKSQEEAEGVDAETRGHGDAGDSETSHVLGPKSQEKAEEGEGD